MPRPVPNPLPGSRTGHATTRIPDGRAVFGADRAYFTTRAVLATRSPLDLEDTVTVGAWTRPAEHLRASVQATIAGVWTLTHTAELGALRLALLPGADDDLALTTAAADLGDAVDALEHAVPDLPRTGVVVDFGDAPLDEVQACRTALAGLILSALATLGHAVTHPVPGTPEATTAPTGRRRRTRRPRRARRRRHRPGPAHLRLLADHRHPAMTTPATRRPDAEPRRHRRRSPTAS